jgi:hypothetical protein
VTSDGSTVDSGSDASGSTEVPAETGGIVDDDPEQDRSI